jgi:hypothetical protein
MNMHRLIYALSAANVALLFLLLAQALAPPATAQGSALLRGRALEIVDASGRVRASIGLLPPTSGRDGASSPETVILRLINAAGQPSVKIATSETAAGLSFVGGDDRSYITLSADDGETLLKMVEPGQRELVVAP